MTLASIGGPLALIALFIPGALDGARASAGLTTLIGSLAFLVPLAIWYRYSERIASPGGLSAFVDAAAGLRLARIQAGFWIVSYFLYIVYTVPYITYDLLPVFLPQLSHSQLLLLDGLLALVIAGLMLSSLTIILLVVAALAISQLVIAIGLTAVNLSHLGVSAAPFIGHGNLGAIAPAAGSISSLYICASLPLFLGGEVRSGAIAVRRAFRWAFPVVALLAVIGSVPLSRTTLAVLNGSMPGVALAQASSGRAFAVVVGLGVCASVGGLIVAEYLALSRLLAAIFHRPNRFMMLAISAAFVVGTAISLIDPAAAYRLLLKPSLLALWISQLVVVAAYPWFVAKHRKLVASDVALAGGASLLMLFALYVTATTLTGT